MATGSERERVRLWNDRIQSSTKAYEKWSKKFETERLEKYYEGQQWKGLTEEEAQKRYTINMVYSTIEVNKPTLIFHRPQIRVQPRPGRNATFGAEVAERARLLQDTVQTFIDDPDVGFALETNLALQEAHFRFGVIEVGYTADFVDNPNAGKPVLKEDKETPVTDSDGKQVPEPASIPKREDLYVRRIPAESFRCATSNNNKLELNDWVGYYEWHYLEDLKKNKAYDTRNLKSTGTIRKEFREPINEDADEMERRHGMVKVWKIWDIRTMKKHVLADGHNAFLQEDIPFSYVPFCVLKFHEILDSFYPLPPVYQWLSPQDEVNETREMQRAHRRRFYRRYAMLRNSIDEDELTKFETGGDGAIIQTNIEPGKALGPVPDAPLDGSVWAHLDASKNDFLVVSGVGGEQRGVAESETATQAQIIDVRSRMRETSARTRVGEWLSSVARLMILCLREKMTLPFWVQRNMDPFAAMEQMGQMQQAVQMGQLDPMMAAQQTLPAMVQMQEIQKEWQQITSNQLGDIDIDVFVDLASMSPVTEEVERNSWNQVLALITNPQLMTICAMSEPILRKTLTLYGIKSENEIKEVQRVCRTMVMMMQQQAAEAAQAEKIKTAEKAGVSPKLIEQARQPQQAGSVAAGGQIGDRMKQITQGPQGARGGVN